MGTPKGRITRSNSNTSITLQDIHNLINSTKNELMTTLKSETEKIHDILSTLTARVRDLEVKLEASDFKQRMQEKEIEVMKESLQCFNPIEVCKTQLDDVCQETAERWRRRKYLIINGIAEHPSGDIEERRARDVERVTDLTRELGFVAFLPEEVSRIGRINSTRPRPLRFKCRDTAIRAQILRNSKKLRNSQCFRNTFVNPDLTIAQRKRNAELRIELKRRRDSGENVTIRHGRIVDMRESNHQNFL